MLERLHIADLAVVGEASIEFLPGLNVLTGSTGAGKSLVMGAVNLLRAERARGDVIRAGAERVSVEAAFRVEGVPGGTEFPPPVRDGRITLRREITADGRSRAWVNGNQVTLKQLGSIASALIEPHGQSEQARLGDGGTHVHYIDRYGGLEDLVSKYSRSLCALRERERELEEYERRLALAREKRELFQHRIEEIERAGLKAGEKTEIEERLGFLENHQAILDGLSAACELIYEGDRSTVELVSLAEKEIRRIEGVDERFASFLSRLEEARIILEDLSSEMRTSLDGLDFDPEELENLQERHAFIRLLERRYGKSIDEIVEEKETWKRELEMVENEEEERGAYERAVRGAAEELEKVALELSGKRKAAAADLDSFVESVLDELGMAGAEFETVIRYEEDPSSPVSVQGKPVRLFEHGVDLVEFHVRTNRGEKMGRMREIASSGELSRIALALKEALAGKSGAGVLVLDEIDSGVGADMGGALAARLLSLARSRQVICITHMPQIAAAAKRHMTIDKRVKGGRTFVLVEVVEGERRKKEIARMLGGSGGSSRRLELAEELLSGSEHASDGVRP